MRIWKIHFDKLFWTGGARPLGDNLSKNRVLLLFLSELYKLRFKGNW